MSEDEAILNEAVDMANEIERLLEGRSTAAAYIAIAKVIGASAADAERPDLCGLMELLSGVAHVELARRMDERAMRAAH